MKSQAASRVESDVSEPSFVTARDLGLDSPVGEQRSPAASAPFVVAALLRTSRRRTDRRLHSSAVAHLVELVTNLIVVIHGPRVHDLDEPSSGVVRVRNGLAGRGSRSQQAECECGKSEFVCLCRASFLRDVRLQ